METLSIRKRGVKARAEHTTLQSFTMAIGLPIGGSMSTAAHYPAVSTSLLPSRGTRAASIPWYIWVGVLAITSSSIGGAWDVSWHRSIGRDTFWTPAHMAIYACGVLAGVICAWLIAKGTFGHDDELRLLRSMCLDSAPRSASFSPAGDASPCSPLLLSTTGGITHTVSTSRSSAHPTRCSFSVSAAFHSA